MRTTKYGELETLCVDCETLEYSPFLRNTDQERCDQCGQMKGRVTYNLRESPKKACRDCADYPMEGGSRGECLLRGVIVCGRMQNRSCFQPRNTEPGKVVTL